MRFKKILYFLLTFVSLSTFSLFSNKAFSNKYDFVAEKIDKYQKENKLNYISGYFVDENPNSNYYSSNYFYRMQQISNYWSYDYQANSIFFNYKNDEKKLFEINNYNIGDETSLLVSLQSSPLERFNFKLLCGSEIANQKEVCDSIYISEKTAISICETIENRTIKREEINKILFEKNNNNLSLSLNKITKDGFETTCVKSVICGVIDNSSLGIYKEIVGDYFVCTNWTRDLQLSITNPKVIALFGNEIARNSTYLRQIDYLTKNGQTLHFVFSNKLNEMKVSDLDQYVKCSFEEFETISKIPFYILTAVFYLSYCIIITEFFTNFGGSNLPVYSSLLSIICSYLIQLLLYRLNYFSLGFNKISSTAIVLIILVVFILQFASKNNKKGNKNENIIS